MKFFNYFFVMFHTLSKERIKSSLRCSEYNELLNGTVYQSIYDYNKMERMDDSNPKMINEFDYYNVTRHALKYGAYTNHLPRDDFKESKKKKRKIKRPNKKKYVEDAMKKINKKEDLKKKDKPIVFLVSPEQLHHYKVYNKTMNRNKQKEIEEKNNNKNSTKKLADDFDDDDYYIWF